MISNELGLDVTHTFWTDSQVVLGYLRNTSKKFHVYVTNRIQQVGHNCDPGSTFPLPITLLIMPLGHDCQATQRVKLVNGTPTPLG